MISTKCESCGKNYKLKDTAAGKTVNCACGSVVKIPLEPNLDENGVALKKSKAKQTLPNQDPIDSKPLTKEQRKYQSAPDLTHKKVCSKCKNIIDMSIKNCPKCGYSTTGIKYDLAKSEETKRKISHKIVQIGKYVIPLVFLLCLLFFFKLQMESLEALKEFKKKVVQKIENEGMKMDSIHKSDPNSDTLLRYFVPDSAFSEFPYFIAESKKKEDVPFSVFGNGFFTLKRAGVCYVVKYTKVSRPMIRHYIEDDKGEPLEINPKEYNLYKMESIAFKFFFD